MLPYLVLLFNFEISISVAQLVELLTWCCWWLHFTFSVCSSCYHNNRRCMC